MLDRGEGECVRAYASRAARDTYLLLLAYFSPQAETSSLLATRYLHLLLATCYSMLATYLLTYLLTY